MRSRQCVRESLSHRAPDRIPVDFGSTAVTGMHVTCVEQLRRHYGLERRPVKVWEPYQMLGEIDEDLQEAMGVDTVGLTAPATLFGFRNEGWKEFVTPWGQRVLVSEHFKTTRDAEGNLLLYPQGDTSAPPSGRMPSSGLYFDTIIRQEPIDDERLNPADNLEEFGPLSDEDLAYFTEQADRLRGSARAVVATVGGTAFGDIALVPAPFLKHPKGIRDVEEWYISTVTRRDYLHAVFSKQCDVALESLERLHPVLAEVVDVLFVCGADFGTQRAPFCSTETFEELYVPYYRRINAWVHQRTGWKTFKHSCGAVAELIPQFIECGFDILNPVQCSAAGMDPQTLKDRFGQRITFWGGGVDTQQTLPFGTPERVREEVLRRCEIFGKDGGFVFNAIHNVQANTPVENIVAMVEAVRETA